MVKDPHIELWVEDEVLFQLFGTICKMWIPPEDFDPFVLHNPVKKNAKYYGAVRVRDGKFVYQRIMGMFDGENFFTFLKYLEENNSSFLQKNSYTVRRGSVPPCKSPQKMERFMQ
jgi:hypothetical protein